MRCFAPGGIAALLLVGQAFAPLSSPAQPTPHDFQPVWQEAEQARAQLHARKARFAAHALPDSLARRGKIETETEQMKDALAKLSQAPPETPPRGLRESAYICDTDRAAQPFLRYLPESPDRIEGLPLLVYLHGYSPALNLLNWMQFSPTLTNLCERLPAAMAMPFGRSNTDFQGIGEQDVLRVVDEMAERYGIDTHRVVLIGYSMGGMGVWSIGARFAERFAGLLPFAARGDYYAWHQIPPERVPPWRRKLIDDAFPHKRLDRLSHIPILAFHGDADFVIKPREARYIFEKVRRIQPDAQLVMLPNADHWIDDQVLAHPETFSWLKQCITAPPDTRPEPLDLRPGETPSRLQNAFLDPFAFIVSGAPDPTAAERRILARADEWERFAKAEPLIRRESDFDERLRQTHHLFVFGEPEHSPLIQAAFAAVEASWTPQAFRFGDQTFPRADTGLWLSVPSPYANGRSLIAQCGVAWGPQLPDNHRYNGLPDVVVYRNPETLSFWSQSEPEILAAGYLDASGQIDWCNL